MRSRPLRDANTCSPRAQVYVTHAAQYGNGTNPGNGAHNDDASYTLVLPVASAEPVLG